MPDLDDPGLRRTLIALLLVACGAAISARIVATGVTYGGDSVSYYVQARSLVIDRDLDYENEFARLHEERSPFTGNRKVPDLSPVVPSTGRRPAKYPVGTGILLVPFFTIGHLVALPVAALGGPPADGFGVIYDVACGVGSLFYTALALLLIRRLGQALGYAPPTALTGTLGIFLGTAWLYYASLDPIHSHTYAAFAVSLFFFVLLRRAVDGHAGWWLVLGACGGLMGLVRYQDVAFALLAPASLVWRWRESIARPGRAMWRLLAFGAGLAAVVSVQLAVHQYLYADPLQTGHAAGGQGFSHMFAPKFLFTALSPQSGFLRWAPVTVLGFLGIWLLRRRAPMVAALSGAAVLGHWYLMSAWDDLVQGDSFGNRHQVSCSVFLALGLMETVHRAGRRWPRLATTASRLSFLGILGAVNLGLIVLYSLRIIGVPY